MSATIRLASIAGVAFLVIALAPRVDAQKIKRESVKPITQVAGSVSFSSYCSVCHGVSGRGDGPAAKALKVPPADLTRIAKRHEGRFPAEEAKSIIKGDVQFDAHGTRDMPMWGPVFRSMENPSVAELRIVNLVRYLRSIQER